MSDLNSVQVEAFKQSFNLLSQSISELVNFDVNFQSELASLSQPLSTLIDISEKLDQVLVDGIDDLSGDLDTSDIITAIEDAAESVEGWVIAPIDAPTTEGGKTWLTLNITISETLVDYGLSVGNSNDADDLAGLSIGEVIADVEALIAGVVKVGIDLTPDLPVDQIISLDINNLSTSIVSSTDVDVDEASFGIVDFGTESIGVNLDASITINSDEILMSDLSVTDVSSLFETDYSSDLSFDIPYTIDISDLGSAVGSELIFKVTADVFSNDNWGFDFYNQAGDLVSLPDFSKLNEISISDIGSYLVELQRLLPDLTDGFDIPLIDADLSSIVDFTEDIGNLISSLQTPEGEWNLSGINDLVNQVIVYKADDLSVQLNTIKDQILSEIPDGELTTFKDHLDTLFDNIDALVNNWNEDGFNHDSLIADFVDQLTIVQNAFNNLSLDSLSSEAQSIINSASDNLFNYLNGLKPESFNLGWNDDAQAIEWTLPLHLELNGDVDFNASNILPDGVNWLTLDGSGSANISTSLDVGIAGGLSISSTANTGAINSDTKLSELNGGAGLVSQGLLVSSVNEDVADLSFTLRNSETIKYDLNDITGLATEEDSQGSATIQHLLDYFNNHVNNSKLTVDLNETSQLVFTDISTPVGGHDFSLSSSSIEIGDSGLSQNSIAPLVLGLLNSTTDENTITSGSLEFVSIKDRLYVLKQDINNPLIEGQVDIDIEAEGQAAIGPLSLSLHEGQAAGNASINVVLLDPAEEGTPADDDRIYLSELEEYLDDNSITGLLNYDLDYDVDGIFQLQVTPEAISNSLLGIEEGNSSSYDVYNDNPLSITGESRDEFSAKVPYLELNLDQVNGSWDISLDPSIKLQELFTNGFSNFSWQDLPIILDSWLDELETDSSLDWLWNTNIPMTSLNIGGALSFRDALLDFELPNLELVFGGLPEWSASISGINFPFVDYYLIDFSEIDTSGLDFDIPYGLSYYLSDLFDDLNISIGEFSGFSTDWGNDGDDTSAFNNISGDWLTDFNFTLGRLNSILSLPNFPDLNIDDLSANLDKLGNLSNFLNGLALPGFPSLSKWNLSLQDFSLDDDAPEGVSDDFDWPSFKFDFDNLKTDFGNLFSGWDNRDDGGSGFDEFDFLVDLSNWFIDFKGLTLPNIDIPDLSSLRSDLNAYLAEVFTFEDIGDVSGLDLVITPSLINASAQLGIELVLEDLSTDIDFSQIDLGDYAFDLSGEGNVKLNLDGSFTSQIGFDTETFNISYETENTSAELQLSIDDGEGEAEGFVVETNFGGLASASIGGNDTGQDRATIELTSDNGGEDYAYIKFGTNLDETNDTEDDDVFGVSAEGELTANLPIYVDTILNTSDIELPALLIADIRSDPEFDFSYDIGFTDLTGFSDTDSDGFIDNGDIAQYIANKISADFSNFSWYDLPIILDSWLDTLEADPSLDWLWNTEIPMTSFNIGEALSFRDALLNFELPNLSDIFDDLDDLSVEFSGLTLPEGDWEDLREEFVELALQWKEHDFEDSNFEFGFLSELSDWFTRLQKLDEPEGDGELSDLYLKLNALQSEVFIFDDVGVENLVLTVSPSISVDDDSIVGLFDLNLNYADVAFALDLSDLSLSNNFALNVTGDGDVSLNLEGDFNTQFGWNFDTSDLLFDLDNTSAELQLSIDDGEGQAEGFIVGAYLGGLASASIGGDDPDQDRATIELTSDNGGEDYAYIKFGTNLDKTNDTEDDDVFGVGAEGELTANLPIYVDTILNTSDIELLAELSASIDLEDTPIFGYEVGFIDFDDYDEDGLTDDYIDEIADYLTNKFSSTDFSINFDSWIDGALMFIDALRTSLSTDLLSNLPYLGDINLEEYGGEPIESWNFSGHGFLANLEAVLTTLNDIDITLGNLQSELQDQLGDMLGEGNFTIDINPIGSTPDSYENLSLTDLFSDGDVTGFTVGLDLSGDDTSEVPLGSLDLDLDGLGIEINGQADLEMAMHYDLDIGFGFSKANGFFIVGDGEDEVTVSAGLGFVEGSELEVSLGALDFQLTDNTSGSGYELTGYVAEDENATNRKTTLNSSVSGLSNEVYAELGIDLLGEYDTSIAWDEISVAGYLLAKLDLDLGVDLYGGDESDLGLVLQTGYYSDETEFATLSYSKDDGFTYGDDGFNFTITDTYIDLGVLVDPLKGLIDQAEQIFEKIEPITNITSLLEEELPLISDVSEMVGAGEVTFLDAIGWFGEGADTVVDYIEMVNALSTAGDTIAQLSEGKLYLGSLIPDNADDLLANNISGDPFGGGNSNEGPNYPDGIDKEGQQASTGPLTELKNNLGISFPIINGLFEEADPQFSTYSDNLFELLFGGDVDLIYWDIPDLDASFDFRAEYPIFPPLYVSLFGGVAFETEFDLAYDTRGIRQLLSSGEPGDLINGLYLDDHIDGNGNDADELEFTATIGAGAELDVLVASAGVDGGLRGELGADLNDITEDGKLYADEFYQHIDHGPLCLFDYSGSLNAFLEAYIKIGFDTWFGFVTLWSDRYKLADEVIVDFEIDSTCPPYEAPVFAKVVDSFHYDVDSSSTAKVLMLLMGDYVNADSGYDIIDAEAADENYFVDVIRERDSEGERTTEIAETGIEIGANGEWTQINNSELSGVDYIWFNASDGKDTVIVSPDVDIAVWGYGGAGADNFIGGSAVNTYYGGSGNDNISGRGANDQLYGGEDNDAIFGFGGADTIDGGDGDDALYGEDADGNLALFREENNKDSSGNDLSSADLDLLYGDDATTSDNITGGDGNDTIIGGDGNDTIIGGDGNDAIIGDDRTSLGESGVIEGNDTIESGKGSDTILAGLGADNIDAGSGDDTINAGHGNDTIIGGEGNDRITGNKGNDTIWGDLEDGSEGNIADSGIGINADTIEGGEGLNTIYGGRGNDIIYANTENEDEDGNKIASDNTDGSFVYGGDHADEIYGTAGIDHIEGGFESDYIDSGDGNDVVIGGPGADALVTGEGADHVYGGYGNDVIDSGEGDDYIEGGPGSDDIYTGWGADTAYGDTTNDSNKGGYQYLSETGQFNQSVEDPLHGGFSATPKEDSCEPEIYYHPEVYAPLTQFTADIFNDVNKDGVRDDNEQAVNQDSEWHIQIIRDDEIVYSNDLTAGDLVAPTSESEVGEYGVWLPSGEYDIELSANDDEWGWHNSNTTTSLEAEVTISSEGQQSVPEFGYFQVGNISVNIVKIENNGNRTSYDSKVYLDSNNNNQKDDDEILYDTDEGQYVFEGLNIGSHQVGIVDDTDCFYVSPEFRLAEVTANTTTNIDFDIVELFPVVTAVKLGEGNINNDNPINWINVPDGSKQDDPISMGDDDDVGVVRIGVEFCSNSGYKTRADEGLITLQRIDGNIDDISFTTEGHNSNWIELVLPNKEALFGGIYRLTISDKFIANDYGHLLDGEWINPSQAQPKGSTFASGDRNPGGQFVFEFTIGDEIRSNYIANNTNQENGNTVYGQVWQDDGYIDNVHSNIEAGINEQTILLIDENGGVVEETKTTSIDANNNGVNDFNEVGVFSFDNVADGTYVIHQKTTDEWLQVTSGGEYVGDKWIAATSISNDNKTKIYNVNVETYQATEIGQINSFTARDIALTSLDMAYLVGKSLNGNDQFLQYNLINDEVTAELTSALSINIKTIVALDQLASDTLIAVSDGGHLASYNIATKSWSDNGLMQDDAGNTLYPIGDIAVVSSNSAYVIASTSTNRDEKDSQLLVKVDPTNAEVDTVVPLSVDELLLGLETYGEQLLAMGEDGNGYVINPSDYSYQNQTIEQLSDMQFGGWSKADGEFQYTDADDFTIELKGSDIIEVGFGNERVTTPTDLQGGNDYIDGGCGGDIDTLYGDDGELPDGITSIGGNDVIYGKSGNDIISGGLQGDTIYGNEGDDEITGGANQTNYIYGGDGDDTIDGGIAGDFIFGGANDDTINGSSGGDWIYGDEGDDTINGENDGDILVGGSGSDEVNGNAGDDLLIVVNELILDTTGVSTYDGGGDNDKLVVKVDANITLSDNSLVIGNEDTDTVGSIESALLVGGDSINIINVSAFSEATRILGLDGNDELIGGSSQDTILGGNGDDTIKGNAGDDNISGESGDDEITGGDDNDIIDGGLGSNIMSGSGGDDYYSINPNSDSNTITEVNAEGNDTVDIQSSTNSLAVELSRSPSIIVADSNSNLEVSVNNGTVEKLILGAGDDIVHIVDDENLQLWIDTGDGSDTLDYSDWDNKVGVDLNTNKASGVLSISNAENIIGSKQNDELIGDSNANIITVGEGKNIIHGGDGDDKVVFTSINTSSIVSEDLDEGQDVLDYSDIDEPLEILFDNDGKIKVYSNTDLIAEISANLTIEKIIAGKGDDVLEGYDTAVWFKGQEGGDKLIGSGKNDVLEGGFDNDIILGGEGDDTLYGNEGNDDLVGDAGDDEIWGGVGDDILFGGDGEDTVIFIGAREDYSIAWSASTSTFKVVSTIEGKDLLSGIELLSFTDITLTAEQLLITLTPEQLLIDAMIKVNDNSYLDNTTINYFTNNTDTNVSTMVEDGGIGIEQSTSFDTVKLSASDAYDFDINITDAIDVLRHIVDLEALTAGSAAYHAADVDNSGAVNITDAIDVLRHIVDLETIDTFDLIDSEGALVTELDADATGDAPTWTLVANGDVNMSGSYDDDYVVTVDIA
jgi:Ca2+-binding RTX toxin-like protein